MTTCPWCGVRISSTAQTCRGCTAYERPGRPCYADALTGGRWVNDNGVQRFVPDEPEPEPEQPHHLIACPTCLARLNQPCRSESGKRTHPHPDRLVSRRCGCGDLLKADQRLCDACRDQARRRNAHAWIRKRRRRMKVAAIRRERAA